MMILFNLYCIYLKEGVAKLQVKAMTDFFFFLLMLNLYAILCEGHLFLWYMLSFVVCKYSVVYIH